MVTLPSKFTATKFPGYFWNTETQTLFSLKIGGVLKELQLITPNHFTQLHGYRVSHLGVRRCLPLKYLNTLKIEDSEIPCL